MYLFLELKQKLKNIILYNKTKNGALKVGASEQQATYEAQLAVYNYHQGFSDGINERNKLISKLSKIVGLS